MDQTTKISMEINLLNTRSHFVIVENEIIDYAPTGRGELLDYFDVEKLLSDSNFYNSVVSAGYNEIHIWLDDFSRSTSKPISKHLIQDYLDNEIAKEKKRSDYTRYPKIGLIKKLKSSDISEFYQLYIYIYIKGIRINEIARSGEYPGSVMLCVGPDENYDSLLGKKELSRYLDSFYYVQPTSAIDKIVGVKKYHDISKFGAIGENYFTGKEEEFVLDMHNFDENIYNFFRKHNALEIK